MGERRHTNESAVSYESTLPPEIMRAVEENDLVAARRFRIGLEGREDGIEQIIDSLDRK